MNRNSASNPFPRDMGFNGQEIFAVPVTSPFAFIGIVGFPAIA